MKKLLPLLILISCMNEKKVEEVVKNTLKKNPQLLADIIVENPLMMLKALHKASKGAQSKMEEEKKKKAEEEFSKAFENPVTPKIRKDEAIRGNKNGKIVMVEYSDFQCPFCSRAVNVVHKFMETYKGNVAFVYKHFPLSFHKQAKISAQYYEAVKMQSHEKAFEFHDELMNNQDKLEQGEKYLLKVAKKLKLNRKKLEKDAKSKAVMDKVMEDRNEASKFKLTGTPSFIINGIVVKGPKTLSNFSRVVNELKRKGKLDL